MDQGRSTERSGRSWGYDSGDVHTVASFLVAPFLVGRVEGVCRIADRHQSAEVLPVLSKHSRELLLKAKVYATLCPRSTSCMTAMTCSTTSSAPPGHREPGVQVCPAVDRRFIPIVAAKRTRTAKYCKSVSEEPTTVVRRLEEMSAKVKLLFHTNNVYDCVTKSKFDYGYGCRHLLNDGIMRATDVPDWTETRAGRCSMKAHLRL